MLRWKALLLLVLFMTAFAGKVLLGAQAGHFSRIHASQEHRIRRVDSHLTDAGDFQKALKLKRRSTKDCLPHLTLSLNCLSVRPPLSIGKVADAASSRLVFFIPPPEAHPPRSA